MPSPLPLHSPRSPLAHHWQLDSRMVFCNHGSFGACPRSVLARQAALRRRMERDPYRFLVRELPPLLEHARFKLAAFVGAQHQDLVFVDNATAAVNTVLASLPLQPGDEILTTDHAYGACRNAMHHAASRSGAVVRTASIPFPIASPQEVIDAVLAACSSRTRLAVIDHVTSPTALVFPIESLVRELQRRDVRVLVDGAHAPGMIALRLDDLGADYFAANGHKWLCAPKGSAFLFVRRDRQSEIRPLVISHAASLPAGDPRRFQEEFAWTGTNDPTARIATSDAIDWGASLLAGGWEERMRRNHSMAVEARKILCDILAIEPPCPESMLGAMASLPLPNDILPAPLDGVIPDPLHTMLRSKYRIDVPIIPWPHPPSRLVRVSAQLYNTLDHYTELALVLARLRSSTIALARVFV